MPSSEWDQHPYVAPRSRKKVLERADISVLRECREGPVDWIWPGCLPRRQFSLLVGFPGVGKSYVAVDLAARLTNQLPWPGTPGGSSPSPNEADQLLGFDPTPARRVVMVTMEDDCDQTVGWRFFKAGGDDTRMVLIDRILSRDADDPDSEIDHERGVDLDRHLYHLASLCEFDWKGVDLVIIDPIIGHYEGGETEARLRSLLQKLARFALDYDVAVLGIAHLRRDPATTDIYRALGSRALASVPRMIWTVQTDPADPHRRLVLPLKANLGPAPAGLAFRFGADRLVWEEASIHPPAGERRKAPAVAWDQAPIVLHEAMQFLQAILTDAELPATEILQRGRELGFSSATMYRAKSELKIASNRHGFGPLSVFHWSFATTAAATDSPSAAIEGDSVADTNFANPLIINGEAATEPELSE